MEHAIRIDRDDRRATGDEDHRQEIRRRVRALLEEGGVADRIRERLCFDAEDDLAVGPVTGPVTEPGSASPPGAM